MLSSTFADAVRQAKVLDEDERVLRFQQEQAAKEVRARVDRRKQQSRLEAELKEVRRPYLLQPTLDHKSHVLEADRTAFSTIASTIAIQSRCFPVFAIIDDMPLSHCVAIIERKMMCPRFADAHGHD